jgi:hypothetical protein
MEMKVAGEVILLVEAVVLDRLVEQGLIVAPARHKLSFAAMAIFLVVEEDKII